MINRDVLKIIALISMTIDHIGYLLFPKSILMRAIGRLAFPIFAYFIAEGFRYTKNKQNYFLRMFAFAILTQILFNFVGLDFVNVLFTFSISIAVLLINQSFPKYGIIALIFGMTVAILVECDYSFYGVMLVWLFYVEKSFTKLSIELFGLTTLLLLSQINFNLNILQYVFSNIEMNLAFFLQYLSLLALPLLKFYNHKKIEYKNKHLLFL